jgi:hypothetical protein
MADLPAASIFLLAMLSIWFIALVVLFGRHDPRDDPNQPRSPKGPPIAGRSDFDSSAEG